MNKMSAKFLSALCLWLLTAAAYAADGTVLFAAGNVAIYRNGQPLPIKEGDAVQSGDAFSTGSDGIVRWKMSDGSYYAIGQNTQMTIANYHLPEASEPPSTGLVLLRLFKGALRTATGLIGHRNPSGWAMKTPTATLGVRGSELIAVVDDNGDTSAQFEEGSGYIQGSDGQQKNMDTGESFEAGKDGGADQSQEAANKINETKQNSSSEFSAPLNTGDTGETQNQQQKQGQQEQQEQQEQQNQQQEQQTSPRIEGDSKQ